MFWGPDANGQYRESKIVTTVHFYDWKREELEDHFNPRTNKWEHAEIRAENTKYSLQGYQQIGPATKKQDCAGYVFQQLWNKPGRKPVPQVWITADNFFRNVIQVFGKDIGHLFDGEKNDILVYGNAKHVALHGGYEPGRYPTADPIIVTKDETEAVYRKVVKEDRFTFWATDPLKQKGAITAWHLDVNKVDFRPMSSGVCDGESAFMWSGQWVAGSTVITVTQNDDTLTAEWVNNFGESPGKHYDKGIATCSVSDDTAKCTWKGEYHDADKDMKDRHGTQELKIQGNTIDCKVTEDGQTAVWRVAKYDSAMKPGAKFHGTWTRKP